MGNVLCCCRDPASRRSPARLSWRPRHSFSRLQVSDAPPLPRPSYHSLLPLHSARIFPPLPPELSAHIARFLPPNEIACTLRPLCRAAAAQFSGRAHTIVRLSLPVPPHAFARHWSRPASLRRLTLTQRHHLLALTAASGSLPNLRFLSTRIGATLTPEPLAAAAAAGHAHVCTWLRTAGCPWGWQVGVAAAAAGQTHICAWLVGQGYTLGSEVLCAAAAAGHTHLCEWLLSHGCPGRVAAAAAAAARGRAEVAARMLEGVGAAEAGGVWLADLLRAAAEGCDLAALRAMHEWLMGEQGAELAATDAPGVVAAAARSGTADWAAKVEWLVAGCGYPRGPGAVAAAAGREDAAARLAALRGMRFEADEAAAAAAAARGDVPALSYLLRECGVAGGERTAVAAARAGQLGALKALHFGGARAGVGAAVGCEAAVCAAAEGGHIDVLAWMERMRVVGGGWSAAVFEAAARSGGVEVLEWLRGRGCDADARAFAAAAGMGSGEVLEWLAGNGCPMVADPACPGRPPDPYVLAGRHSDFATLACLRRLGVPWGAHAPPHAHAGPAAAAAAAIAATGAAAAAATTLTEAIACGCPLPVLRWLAEAGCPTDWAAAVRAVKEARGADAEVRAWVKGQAARKGKSVAGL